MKEIIVLSVLGAVILGYVIYIMVKPNDKSITEHFRGDDEKYE